MLLREWTVDYGQGPTPCTIPHAWRQDVPVTWEGPAIYRCRIEFTGPASLVFHGVSYQARVFLDDELVGTHEGIWDSFSIDVEGRGSHELRVEVIKNGGPTFPVREVASGFLPFVYHTFGGIYKAVELKNSPSPRVGERGPGGEGLSLETSSKAGTSRYSVQGQKVQQGQPGKAQSASFKSQAEEWLAKRSKEVPSDLSSILHSRGKVGEREALEIQAQELGLAFVDLERHKIDSETIKLVPSSVARKLRALPLRREGNTLWVAFGESEVDAAKIELERVTGYRIVIVLGMPSNIQSRIEAEYGTPTDKVYLRGVLTWGWYPDLGHANPPDDVIRREIDQAKKLGFNLIKFCLWVPPHRYLEIMEEAGMHAWIELPLWDPVDDTDAQERIAEEFRRIVEQYLHHPNVALWTCGCELHATTSAAYRKQLYDIVKELTGGLVKDNSGSAEMYGGDLREYGDFYDFHPYCDLPYFPEVLDSLLTGPRKQMPILLGEFNDIDLHRDLARLAKEQPYWISADPALNDQGVRWQYDLPGLMPENRFANAPEEHRHAVLMTSSRSKAAFIRKYVQEAVRARDDIAGYVVTGWRDTPISSAGMIDDWDEPRFKPEDVAHWNGDGCLFLIPTRRPPWVNGGNRPGWLDPFNWFEGRAFWKIGVHRDREIEANLEWDILHFSWQGNRRPKGRVAQGSGRTVKVGALESTEVGEISWDTDEPGGYLLRVQFGDITNTWPFWVVPPFEVPDLRVHDPAGVVGLIGSDGDRFLAAGDPGHGDCGIVVLTDVGTAPAPFWRESAYEFHNAPFWEALGYREAWERLLPLTPDRVLDAQWVRSRWPDYDWEVLMNRIDVRTYREAPTLMVGRRKKDCLFVTTLRPFGGLGNTPRGVSKNPSGANFVQKVLGLID